MTAERHLERELKFDVEPEWVAPDLSGAGRIERLPDQRLETTYFDTAEYRLWSQGITLRHRVESDAGPDSPGKWTVKLPEPAPDETRAHLLAVLREEWASRSRQER